MNCLKCAFQKLPPEERTPHCIACSTREYKSHRFNCNELSNAGQTIESLDNHNPNYSDDRDIVSKIDSRYSAAIKSASKANADPAKHPARHLSSLSGTPVTSAAYDKFIGFIYELTSLNELALCLFFSTIKREEKATFASRHNMSPTKVNNIYRALIDANPGLANFILLTNGTLDGLRGRKPGQKNKPKDGDSASATTTTTATVTATSPKGAHDPRRNGNYRAQAQARQALPRSIADTRISPSGIIFQQLTMF